MGSRVEWRRQEVIASQTDAIAGLMRELNRTGYAPETRRLIQRAVRSQWTANVRTCRALYPLETECLAKRAA